MTKSPERDKQTNLNLGSRPCGSPTFQLQTELCGFGAPCCPFPASVCSLCLLLPVSRALWPSVPCVLCSLYYPTSPMSCVMCSLYPMSCILCHVFPVSYILCSVFSVCYVLYPVSPVSYISCPVSPPLCPMFLVLCSLLSLCPVSYVPSALPPVSLCSISCVPCSLCPMFLCPGFRHTDHGAWGGSLESEHLTIE